MNYRAAAFTVENFWTATVGSDDTGVRNEKNVARINFAEANALLADPPAAELRARAILGTNATGPIGRYLLGAALHRQQRHEAARAILEPLAQSQPQMGSVLRELGLVLAKLGARESATAALLKALDLNCMDEDVLFALGDLLTFEGVPVAPTEDETAPALSGGPFEAAETALRKTLAARPDDARAMKTLADLLVRRGRWPDAQPLYERCLELAPDFGAARFRYATQLFVRRDFDRAGTQIERLLRDNQTSVLLHALKAMSLVGSRQPGAAIAAFDSFMEDCTDKPGLWLEYARVLRANRDSRAAGALKRAIAILPSFVDAYVFYASIKPFAWDQVMIDQVRAQLARGDLAAEDRAQLHSALGKAYEDLGRYAESFGNYRTCNEILRQDGDASAKASANFVRRTSAVFNPMLFRKHARSGFPASDPIFIVGMKRSGSTLVEQILSRHPAIEALGELDDLTDVTGRVRGYPNVLKELDAAALYAMGKEYMALTAPRRNPGKPFFTDKLPHNFGRVGLIHLILPNAKIIDVRRHPLDCGLSCYKHYFPGARISLNLADFASGYVDYVRLMAHFDRVLPGKVHRVIYERLVGNLEHEVRRLLNYLGLPFAAECLRFHEETRRVDTPSADQVRTPLYNSAVEYWRNYEQWLGPMKEKLGYVLDAYPDVPRFYDEIHARIRRPFSLGQTGGHFKLVRGLRQPRIEIA